MACGVDDVVVKRMEFEVSQSLTGRSYREEAVEPSVELVSLVISSRIRWCRKAK